MIEIERCRSWIEAALAYAPGTHTFDDVAGMIEAGRLQLWPAMHGCLVTEIVDYPAKARVQRVSGRGNALAVVPYGP